MQNKSRIALSPDRIATLTDGIFAIAMTILVLNISTSELPPDEMTEGLLIKHLGIIRHQLINYVVSFLLLGVFWLINHQQFQLIKKTDIWHLWLNMFALVFVCLVPFSASLMAKYHDLIGAAVIFEVNVLLIGGLYYLQWCYAVKHGLLVDNLPEHAGARGKRMSLVLPVLAMISSAVATFDPHSSLIVYLALPVLFWALRKKLFILGTGPEKQQE